MKIKLANKLIEIFPGVPAPTDLIYMRVSNIESFGTEYLRKNKKPVCYTCVEIDSKMQDYTSRVDAVYHYRYACKEGTRSAFEFKVNGHYIATFWYETDEKNVLPTDCKTLGEAFSLSQKLSEALLSKNFKEIR